MTPLRQRMTEDMQVRNLSPHTQTSYLQQVSLFARHFNKSPEQLGPEDIRAYQVYLTNERKLSPSSILIAVSAPKKPQRLPVVLSPEEVLHFLQSVGSTKHRAILTTCYAAGLRISESVHLKPTDVDSQRMVIRVEQGKGQKDRYVMLSPKLLETLRYYWRAVRPKGLLFEGDIPGINTLGRILEVVSDQCERFLEERIFKPIGMSDTFFFPPPEKYDRIASVYDLRNGKLTRADIDLHRVGSRYTSALGGLFSTASDMAAFYQMMLRRGEQ